MVENSNVDDVIASFCAQQRVLLEQELHSEDDTNEPQQQKSPVGVNATTSAVVVAREDVLHRLAVDEITVGLYGRTVLQFVPIIATTTVNDDNNEANQKQQQRIMPSHRFTTGDEVEIRWQHHESSRKNRNNHGGVVCAVTESSISVALFSSSLQQRQKQRTTTDPHNNNSKVDKNNNNRNNNNDNDDDDDSDGLWTHPPYTLLARSNVEVHKKYLAALTDLATHGIYHPISGPIIQALFEPPPAVTTSTPPQEPQRPASGGGGGGGGLDESQCEAIAFALSTNQPVALIHGPPGTGKTTTLVQLIRQAIDCCGFKKILVTAPSNVAVDNILARLVDKSSSSNNNYSTGARSRKPPRKQQQLKVVRIGHPARLQPAILPYCLEALVQNADGSDIVRDVRNELQAHLSTLNRPQPPANSRRDRVDKRYAYSEVKALRKEIRVREERVVTEILQNAQVVLATCVGAGNAKLLSALQFDLVVIDEAAQALEVACWIPALQARTKLVLAGDHLQLPPTIKSNARDVQLGLSRTMFQRVMELYGDDQQSTGVTKLGRVSRMLKVQYRMHETIANWASHALYHDELLTHESVKSRTLAQLVNKTDQEPEAVTSFPPLLLIDTAGCEMYETENAAGSRYNDGEAQLVIQHVRTLLSIGIPPDQIAVISPYNGQVESLRLALLPEAPKLQIRSVDGFQGGEREAVVLSLVRSSRGGGRDGIGFLSDHRRLNVAVTRAKRHCCVIADSETVSQSPFIRNLVDWIDIHGETRSAMEQLMSNDDYGSMNADLEIAELEIQRLMTASKSKDRPVKKATDPNDMDRRRTLLEETIRTFQTTSKPGDVMTMNAELTNLDRKLVHEIAEQLGVHHESHGVQGIDRRIQLKIPVLDVAVATTDSKKNMRSDGASDAETNPQIELPAIVQPVIHDDTAAIDDDNKTEDLEEPRETDYNGTTTVIHAFDALRADLDEDEEDDDDPIVVDTNPDSVGVSATAAVAAESALDNSVLANLARERMERRRQQERSAVEQVKPKTKKSYKLGGTQRRSNKVAEQDALDNNNDTHMDDDDMAFLDAQIDKVQNSHGRQVAGSGKEYRTIINGVLLAKPVAPEKKRDTKAAAALNSKLQNARDKRKAKPKS